ncbi:MAG: tail fiber domain-containing protein [Patescibacteria group bacterium]|nr:tail fiber domain-containing protein [Patescibacteria group bacterium]
MATTTLTPSSEFTTTGTLGALIGGTNSTLSLATNGIALTKLAQIAPNTILGNPTGATGNVQAFATSSLGIALSDTTGTLAVSRGGTGATSFTSGNLLYGSGTNALQSVATTSATLGLGLSGTLTTLNNVAQSLSIATSSLYTGTTGQLAYFNGTNSLTGTSDLFDSAGNIGVGTTSPYAKLAVGGDTVIGAATAGGTLGNLYLPKLGTSAGTFLAVDAAGKVIATTTPSGTVTSVSNADGTLTISPTTGDVVASLNLSHANTWTGRQTLNGGFTAGVDTTNIVGSTTSAIIGTTGFTVQNNPYSNDGLLQNMEVRDNTAVAAGVGGAITLSGQYHTPLSATDYLPFAAIKGAKEDGSTGAGHYGGAFEVYTSNASTGALAKQLSLSSAGVLTLPAYGAGALQTDASGNVTSATLPVSLGGTGATSFTSSNLIYGAGTGALQSVATTSVAAGTGIGFSGTAGALVGGAGLTITNNGLLSLQQLGGGTAQTGAITLATSSAATSNGVTVGENITNVGTAFTFTPTVAVQNIPNSALQNSTIALTDSNSTLTIGGSPASLGGTLTATLNLAHGNTWTALQQFSGNASSTQFTSTGSAFLATGGGNVGIGTGAPGANLEVYETSPIVRLSNTAYRSFDLGVGAHSDPSTTFSIYDVTGAADRLSIDASGNVGIGKGAPAARLDVLGGGTTTGIGFQVADSAGNVHLGTLDNGATIVGSSTAAIVGTTGFTVQDNPYTVAGTFPANAELRDNSAYATGVGGGLTFSGQFRTPTSNTDYTPFGAIKGQKENSTSGNAAGALGLYTASSGGVLAEQLHLSSAGALKLDSYTAGALQSDASGNVTASTLTLANGGTGTTTGGVTNGVEYYNGTTLTNGANLTFDGTTLTANALHLTNALTVPYGGTGATSFTSSNLIYGAGTGALQSVATSSITAGTGVTFSGTPGALVGGSGFTVNTPWTASGSNIYNNNAGNVGIGTTSPAYGLDVEKGNIFVSNGVGANNGKLYFPSNGITPYIGTSAYQLGVEYGSYNFNITRASGTSVAYFTSTGNVGIGTTNPQAKLDVLGTASSTNLYTAGTVQFAGITSGILTADTAGNVTASSSVNINQFLNGTLAASHGGTGTTTWQSGSVPFYNGTNFTEDNPNFYYDATHSRLGLGTKSPSGRLEVAIPAGGSYLDIANFDKVQSGADYGGYVIFQGGVSGTTPRGYLGFAHTSTGGATLLTGELADAMLLRSEGAFQLGTGGNNIALTVDATQHVGIGTAAPLSKLDVNGGVAIGSYAGANAAPSNGLIVSGNVGIGTTTPSTQLELGGTSNWMPLIVGGTSSTGVGAAYLPSSNYPGFATWAGASGNFANKFFISKMNAINSSSELVTITSTGNVGIGTTSPYAQLALGGGNLVVGAATAGGAMGSVYLPAITSSYLATDASGKVVATTTLSAGAISGIVPIANGGTNNSSFTQNGVVYYDGTRLTNNANFTYDGTNISAVGPTIIGSSTSAIASSIGFTVQNNAVSYNGSGFSANADIRDNTAMAAGVGGGLAFSGQWRTPTSNTDYVSFAAIKGQKENGTSANANGALGLYTGSGGVLAERMHIDSSGNVGIGTTNPQAKLDVQGTASSTKFSAAAGSASAPSFTSAVDTTSGIYQDTGGVVRVAVGGSRVASFISAGLQLLAGNTSAASPSLSVDSAGNTGLFTPGAGVLGFTNGGTESMRITSTGNVGIGTTNPQAKLDVASGDIYLDDTNGATRSLLWRNSSTGGTMANLSTYYAGNWGGTVYLWVGRPTGGVGQQNAFTTGVVDDPTGYPNQNTHVSFNTTATTSVSSNGVVYIGLGSNSANTRTSLYTENGAIFAATRGNVGVGTTGPLSKLSVNGVGASNFALYSTGDSTMTMGVGGKAGTTGGWGGVFYNSSGGNEVDIGGGTYGMIVNAGNVGIGTTTPAANLDVYGSILSENSIPYKYTLPSTGAVDNLAYVDTTDNLYLGRNNQTLALRTTGNVRLTVDSNGNVGIGTTTPNRPLDVEGAIQSESSQSTNVVINPNAYSYGAIYGLTGAGATTNLLINPAGGNVGIGTTSPALQLHLYQPSGATLALDGGSTAQPFIDWRQANVEKAYIQYVNSGGYLNFNSNTGNGFAFTNGNVGIGTTSPAHALQVAGRDGVINGSMYRAVQFGSDANGQTSLVFGRSADTSGWNGIQSIASEGSTYGNLVLNPGGGNVGIGTTNPGNPLEVWGTGGLPGVAVATEKLTDNSAIAANVGPTLVFSGNYSGTTKADFGGIAVKRENGTNTNYDAYMAFYTGLTGVGNPERMRITSSGNVGIGTTSPASMLNIYGGSFTVDQDTSAAPPGQIAIRGKSNQNQQLLIGYNTTSDYGAIQAIKQGTGYEPLALQQGGGNVGIGTTTPGAPLTLSNSGTLLVSLDSTGTSYGYQRFTRSSTSLGSLGYESAAGGSFLTNGLPNAMELYGADGVHIAGNGNAASGNITVATSGNVGIGTTNPGGTSGGKLEVYDSSALTSFTGTTAEGLLLSGNGTYNDLNEITLGDSAGGILYGRIAGWKTGSGSYLSIGTSNNYASGITNQALTIDYSGRVGIGTTTPNANLVVSYLGGTAVSTVEGNAAATELIGTNAGSGNRSWALANNNWGTNTGLFSISYSSARAADPLAGTAAFTISSAGNVGIGVGGTAAADRLSVQVPTGTTDIADFSKTQSTNDTGGLIVFYGGSAANIPRGYLGFTHTGSGADTAFTGENADSIALRSEGALNLGAGGNNLAMTIASSGYVGIGTTSPGKMLNLDGGSLTNPAIEFSTNLRNWHIGIAGPSADLRVTQTGVADVMTFQNGGNVGIGTTNPGTKLTVGDGSADVRTTDKSNANYQFAAANASGNAFYYGATQDATPNGVISNNAGTAIMTLLNGGNVGIGTTSPYQALSVNGGIVGDISNSAGNAITLSDIRTSSVSGSTYTIPIQFSGYHSSNVAAITAYHNEYFGSPPNALTFSVSGSEAMRITNGGNVGIGTASPGNNLLDVYSGSSGVGSSYNSNGLAVESSGRASIELRYPNANDGYVFFRDPADGSTAGGYIGRNGYSQSPSNLMVLYNTGNFDFSGGNVGIGTVNPGQKLTVSPNNSMTFTLGGLPNPSLAVGAYGVNPSDGIGLFVHDTTSGYVGWAGAIRTGSENCAAWGCKTMRFQVPDTSGNVLNALTIAGNTGNVGIGTASPGGKLQVDNTTSQYLIYGSTGNLSAYDAEGNGAGIETRLGSAYNRPGVYVGGGDLNLLSSGNVALGAGGNTTDMYINTSGNVGIGTTSPNATLSVSGNQYINGTSAGATTLGSGNFALQIGPQSPRSATANSYYGGIAFNHLLNYSGVTTYNNTPQAWIGTRLNSTAGSELDYLVFATKSGTTNTDVPVERMTIDPTGNVGIGNTSPSSLLSLGGQTQPAIQLNSSNYSGSYPTYLGVLSGAQGVLQFGNNGPNYIVAGDTAAGGSLNFVVNNTSTFPTSPNGSTAMVIDSSGNTRVYGQLYMNSNNYIYSTSRYTYSNNGDILFNNGTGQNLVLAETASNIYTFGGGSPGGAPSSVLSMDMLNTRVGVGNSAPSTDFEVGTNFQVSTANTAGNIFEVASSTGTAYLSIAATTGNATFHGSGGTCTITGAGACSSDRRLKTNIVEISGADALAGLSKIHAVTFNWADPTWEQNQELGVIAQDVQSVFPQLVSTATTTFDGTPGQYYVLNYANLTAPLITGVNTLNAVYDATNAGTTTPSLASYFQGTTTPAIVIDANGNVGIGTTTNSMYKVAVGGDIEATGFVNLSEGSAKTDITHITATSTLDGFLSTVRGMMVAEYRYKNDATTTADRLGFIAEESPQLVRSNNGKGIDLYKLITLAIGSIQSLADKMDQMALAIADLQSRVAALETAAKTRTSDVLVSTGGAVSGAAGNVAGSVSSVTGNIADAVNSFLTSQGVAIANGVVAAHEVAATQFNVTPDANGESAAGTAAVPAGATFVTVRNTYVTSTSRVFVTFTSDPGSSWYVASTTDGSFTLAVNAAPTAAASFNYFIVGTATSTPPAATTATGASSGTISTTGGDTQAPTIQINGNNPATVAVGASYVDLGAIVTDNVDQNVAYYASVDGGPEEAPSKVSIDTSAPGTHTVSYTATDNAGNTATATRTIIVGSATSTASTSTPSSTPTTSSTTAAATTQSTATTSPTATTTSSSTTTSSTSTATTSPSTTSTVAATSTSTGTTATTTATSTATSGSTATSTTP